MPNHPSQDHPSQDQQFGRGYRDPYRDTEYGDGQRRQWPQEGGRSEGSYGNAPYNEREFYELNAMSSNYGAPRGGRPQHRNDPWPRNEDRENYSAAGEYGKADYREDNGQPATGRYHAAGNRRDYAAGGQGNRGYNQAYRDYGQNFGSSPGTNYSQMQEPTPWRDNQTQLQPFRGYQGDPLPQGDYYGVAPSQYGMPRNIPQPGYFQAGDFSQRAGYTRSEYPEDTSYLYGHPHYRDNQQAGRSLETQNWQEREGAQRGAFGLQSSHRGLGPQGYTRSDERIKEDVCERLSEHHYIDASLIRVEVSQGVVTLEGAVDDRWQKYQTEDLVDAISGVKDIQNRLNVSRASRQSAQWTAQPATPQSANPQQSGADTGASKRPIGEKSSETTRGKPGLGAN